MSRIVQFIRNGNGSGGKVKKKSVIEFMLHIGQDDEGYWSWAIHVMKGDSIYAIAAIYATALFDTNPECLKDLKNVCKDLKIDYAKLKKIKPDTPTIN